MELKIRPRENIEKVIIKEGDREVAGCILHSLDKMMILYSLFAEPEYRNKGYAIQCIKKAIEKFNDSGMTILMAGTKVKIGQVRHIFQKCGFEEMIIGKEIILYLRK